MAHTGWNKVIESNGNVYYHNKHTGVMRFSPPSSGPDNVPLKRALKMKSFDRVKDSRGGTTRGYHLGENIYVSATQYEGAKYVHIGNYMKSGKKLPEMSTEGLVMDDGVWDELCRNKNLITELVTHYHTSSNNGACQQSDVTHPEKCRMLLGKQCYVRVIVEDEKAKVDIRYFDNALQSIEKEIPEYCWAVIPAGRGITLDFHQWKKMASLEGLFAIEHMKSLANVPFLREKKSLAKRRKVELKLHIPATTPEEVKPSPDEMKT